MVTPPIDAPLGGTVPPAHARAAPLHLSLLDGGASEGVVRTGARRALLLVLLWSIPALFSVVERYVYDVDGEPVPALWRVVVAKCAGWYAWAALTPLVFRVARAFPLRAPVPPRRWAVHLAACGAVCLLHALAFATGNWVADAHPSLGYRELVGRAVLGWLPISVLVYLGLVGAEHWLSLARQERDRAVRTAAVEAQLARAELQALRMQLHPHFLFNALNTIAALVRDEKPGTAVDLIARLGSVLRAVLATAQSHEVPLHEELAFTRAYLEIEQARFADRLRVTWTVDADAAPASVPSLVLQPLVENALRHGIARREDAGRLEIGARREDDRLVLWVGDDGPGLSDAGLAGVAGGGIGLANVRARLARLYGPDASLRLAPVEASAPSGCVATVVLPWRVGQEASGE